MSVPQALHGNALQPVPPWRLVSLLGSCARCATLLMHHPYQRRFATTHRMSLLAQCTSFVEMTAHTQTASAVQGVQLMAQARQSAADSTEHDSDLVAVGGEDLEAYKVLQCAIHAVEGAMAAAGADRVGLERAVCEALHAAEQCATSNAGQQAMVQGLREDVQCLI